MTTGPMRDDDWGRIANLPEQGRQAALRQMMQELSNLPEEERQQRLKKQAETEYSLPDDQLRTIIVSRIRVWLDMDPNMVKAIGASMDKVMGGMPSNIAMKRIGIVQTVSRDFPPDQQEKLRSIVPGAFPHSGDKTVSMARLREEAQTAAAGSSPEPKAKKPFWKFW